MTAPDTNSTDLGYLQVIEWGHLDLGRFYPVAMVTSWSVRCLLYPMSVVKSRLQLQRQKTVYRGTFDAFRNIVKLEGAAGLYRKQEYIRTTEHHSAVQLSWKSNFKGFWVTIPQVGTSFIYATVYERLRSVLQSEFRVNSILASALAGGVASTCTQTVFVPTDIVAQHMMICKYPRQFTASPHTVRLLGRVARRHDGPFSNRSLGLRVIGAVYHIDGMAGFYKGFFASLMLYIPSSMIFWAAYNFCLQKDFLGRFQPNDSVLLLNQAFSGVLSGLAVAVCTNPLDVYRIRIQIHRTSYLDTFLRMVRHEGRLVFSKGLLPRIISHGTYSCLSMLGYESLKRWCVLPEYKRAVKW